MKKLFICLLLVVAACSYLRPTPPPVAHNIGVISIVGDQADFVFIGRTKLADQVNTATITGFGIDKIIEDKIISEINSKEQYRADRLKADKEMLMANNYSQKPLALGFTRDKGFMDLAITELGRKQKYDMVVVVMKRPGGFGSTTSASILVKRDFLNQQGTMISSSFNIRVVNMATGKNYKEISTVNVPDKNYNNITASPSKKLMPEHPLWKVEPKKFQNYTVDELRLFTAEITQNLNYLLPLMVEQLGFRQKEIAE